MPIAHVYVFLFAKTIEARSQDRGRSRLKSSVCLFPLALVFFSSILSPLLAQQATGTNLAAPVGIGTTTPINMLEIGGGSLGIQVTFGAQNHAVNIYENRNNNPNWLGASIDFLNALYNYGGGLAFSYHPSNGVADSNVQTGMVLNTFGNVGINTTTPSEKLEVVGNVKIDGSGSGLVFPDGTIQTTASNAASVGGVTTFANPAGTAGFQFSSNSQTLAGLFGGGGGNLALQANSIGTPTTGSYLFLGGSARADALKSRAWLTNEGSTYSASGVLVDQSGNVGIGFDPSNAYSAHGRLEVNGSVTLTPGTGASITFADNTVQGTAWNGVLTGGDYAESVDVSGDRGEYEPGDVLVIDPNSDGKFLKASAPYSTLVAGIYSTRPGVIGRRQLTARAKMKDEVPMAMTGIVPTKVSTENGPVKPGDLLVTSSQPGYAMKGTDRGQMLGAVIGKAIGHLDGGTGVIEAVVTLQ